MYDDKTIEVQDKAIVLILGVRQAMNNGTKHYRKSDNCILETEREVLKALVDEGEIILEPITKYNKSLEPTEESRDTSDRSEQSIVPAP